MMDSGDEFEMETISICFSSFVFSSMDSSPVIKRRFEGIIVDSSVLAKHGMQCILSLKNPH